MTKKDEKIPGGGLGEEGDPYVIVVSQGGPPSDEEGVEPDIPPVFSKNMVFPVTVAGAEDLEVDMYAKMIDVYGNSITEPVQGTQDPENKDLFAFVLDYNKVSKKMVTLLYVFFYDSTGRECQVMTIPIASPMNGKKQLTEASFNFNT